MGELSKAPVPGPLGSRKAVGAAVMGNLLEWYDFAVYGYLATIVARNFFPQEDEKTAKKVKGRVNELLEQHPLYKDSEVEF